jgi:hypothetical protein
VSKSKVSLAGDPCSCCKHLWPTDEYIIHGLVVTRSGSDGRYMVPLDMTKRVRVGDNFNITLNK